MDRRFRIGFLFVVFCVLFGSGAMAQTIKNGTQWWDGIRLYTAQVDAAGNVRMEGVSEDMGDDSCEYER